MFWRSETQSSVRPSVCLSVPTFVRPSVPTFVCLFKVSAKLPSRMKEDLVKFMSKIIMQVAAGAKRFQIFLVFFLEHIFQKFMALKTVANLLQEGWTRKLSFFENRKKKNYFFSQKLKKLKVRIMVYHQFGISRNHHLSFLFSGFVTTVGCCVSLFKKYFLFNKQSKPTAQDTQWKLYLCVIFYFTSYSLDGSYGFVISNYLPIMLWIISKIVGIH